MSNSKIKTQNCLFCGAKEGKLHKKGCCWEICVKCKKRYKKCSCIVKNSKREPYIYKPQICLRCGKLYPKSFMVSDKEWEKVCGVTYNLDVLLCEKCYDYIRKARKIKKGKRRHINHRK